MLLLGRVALKEKTAGAGPPFWLCIKLVVSYATSALSVCFKEFVEEEDNLPYKAHKT